MPQEEDTYNTPMMPALQPNPVPEPEDEVFPRSASPDMAFIFHCITVDTYNMNIREQEYLISRSLDARSSDVPFYRLSSLSRLDMHIRSGDDEAGPSQQSENLEEEVLRYDITPSTQNEYTQEEVLPYDITPSTQNVHEREISEPALGMSTNDTRSLEQYTSPSVHADVSPPPERVMGFPMPYTLRVRSSASMPQPSSAAMRVANRVINYARAIRNAREEDISCLDCGYYPVPPITGKCGHTRCAKCIQDNGKCPCGNDPPETLNVNVLIQDLINKAISETSNYRGVTLACNSFATGETPRAPAATAIVRNERLERVNEPRCGHGAIRRARAARAHFATPYSYCSQRVPISLQARYNHALKLLAAKRYLEAAPHLALAAGSSQPGTRAAHTLLAQVITIICKDQDPKRFNRQLNRSVRQLLSTSWIKLADMECILCAETFTNPVTTPCGHMFCRTCIERTLDYHKRCPLCQRSLQSFILNVTRETVFVQAALSAIHALNVPDPLEPDLIPMFVCTVAYPSVPCPLIIIDPRYWLMIRRVLESGSRKFGMLHGDRDCLYATIGTLLEVRDCVHLEDGRSILSTVGVSRFRVIEKIIKDGCEVARIRPINDVLPPRYRNVTILRLIGNEIIVKAITWLLKMDPQMVDDIETTFGQLPHDDFEEGWWETADGPRWLWWLVAVLPLRSQVKFLILSTDCLFKRMMAVMGTLDILISGQVAVATPRLRSQLNS